VCACIAKSLNQDVDHVPVLVHSPSEIATLTFDLHEDVIQVPTVAEATLATHEVSCAPGSALPTPLPDGLDIHPLRQESLHVRKRRANRWYSQTPWLMIREGTGGRRSYSYSFSFAKSHRHRLKLTIASGALLRVAFLQTICKPTVRDRTGLDGTGWGEAVAKSVQEGKDRY
jgi:hypothetical protein